MLLGHHTGMDRAPVADWEGHVIVCGLQGVGLRMVEQLHQAGVQVVVVDEDPDPRLVRIVEGWEIPFIVGSPRIGGFLDRAGLARARAVVCAERTEVQTLETALLVSERRPDIRVVVQLANAAVGAAVSDVTGPGHGPRRGRPGRPVHRGGLPGKRLVPDRVRGRPVHDLRGGGGPFRHAPGPVRRPGPHRRGPRRRLAYGGLPRTGLPGPRRRQGHRARDARRAGGGRPPAHHGRATTGRRCGCTTVTPAPVCSGGSARCWPPTTTAPCVSPSSPPRPSSSCPRSSSAWPTASPTGAT